MKGKLKAVVKSFLSEQSPAKNLPHWLDVEVSTPGASKEGAERVAMTISCRDSDYIPKIKSAGSFKEIAGKRYQIMHNGMLIEADGYYGEWMSEIISALRGHHEPQEEKVFYELLKLVQPGGTMIELGAYWSYYSIWFNMTIKNATNYCCEPDPVNLELGQRNATINKTQGMNFVPAAAGKDDGVYVDFTPQEGGREDVHVPIRSVDGLVEEYGIQQIDILHMDVQGAEMSAIEGAEAAIKSGKVRFAIISTHHYCISGDPILHEKCLDKVKSLGGHVIVEHAIHESFSGDGLIAVSFFDEDKDLQLSVSENRMQNSLFRSYNQDLAILSQAYEASRQK